MVRSQSHRLDGVCDGGECAYQNHDDIRVVAVQPLKELHTGNARHPHVGDDEVGLLPLDVLQGFGSGLGFADFVRRVVQRLPDEFPIWRVVVNHKDCPRHWPLGFAFPRRCIQMHNCCR